VGTARQRHERGEVTDVDDLGSPWAGGWTGSHDEQFTSFMRSAGPVLTRMAWLLTGDRHHAEELTQQTLVRTYAAWPRARRHDPMAYARRVLVNTRTDVWRKSRREVLVAEDDDAPGGAVGSSTSGHHVLAERDALVRALRLLSHRRRQVVVLRYLMDMTEAQVADDLDVSVGTVKSTAARGLAQLRRLLADPTAVDAPTSAPHPEVLR